MTRLRAVIDAPLGGGSPSAVTDSSAVVHPAAAGSVDTTAYKCVMSSRKAKIPECSRPLGPQNQPLAGIAIDALPCCRATSRRPLHWWIGGCRDRPAWISRSASKPGTVSSPASNTPTCAGSPRVIPGSPPGPFSVLLPPGIWSGKQHGHFADPRRRLDAQLVTGALEDAHHARVAHEHVGPEAPNAARSRVLEHARVEEPAQAGALPFRIHHVGHFGKAGRRAEVVGAGGHDPFMLGRAYHGCEGHLLLIVDAAEVLGDRVGERAQLLKEAALHVFFREPVEKFLHGAAVACPRRAHADLAAIAQPNIAHFGHRIRAAAAQLLLRPDKPSLDGGAKQGLPII